MSKKILLTISCYVLLTITGCSYQFDILIKGNDPFHPIFTLNKSILAFPTGREVLLNDFGVYIKKEGQWDYKNPVWRFALHPGASKAVRRIEYSRVPSEFSEITKSKTLIANVSYLVMGFGSGGTGGTEFIIIKGNNGYIIKTPKGK